MHANCSIQRTIIRSFIQLVKRENSTLYLKPEATSPGMDESCKLEVVNESSIDEFSRTFTINAEDHTLANSLRYLLMKNPNVVFCGYTIPHPSEFKVNLRIQTNRHVTALDVLETGLNQLNQQCDHVLTTFDAALAHFDRPISMEC